LAAVAALRYSGDMTSAPRPNIDTPRGFGFALIAYLLWGFLPLYMKQMAHIPTLEVLVHRVIWSVPIALAILAIIGRTAELKAALKSPRMLAMGVVTASLISMNWGIYVWSIQTGHALEAALGYYINPLFSVFLGAVLIKERLSLAQKLAIALAVCAVGFLTLQVGKLPLVALSLTLTWGFYAYFKKMLPIGPNQGFALEVILLLPFALAYAVWLEVSGGAVFLHGSGIDNALLIGCGVITAVPLMIYANGAKMLRLSTIGIMQYITPTMIFLTAVFWFGEPFDQARLLAFVLIWAALVIYTSALIRQARSA
jgi:chloramphenicol-sensitive protein RarD